MPYLEALAVRSKRDSTCVRRFTNESTAPAMPPGRDCPPTRIEPWMRTDRTSRSRVTSPPSTVRVHSGERLDPPSGTTTSPLAFELQAVAAERATHITAPSADVVMHVYRGSERTGGWRTHAPFHVSDGASLPRSDDVAEGRSMHPRHAVR